MAASRAGREEQDTSLRTWGSGGRLSGVHRLRYECMLMSSRPSMMVLRDDIFSLEVYEEWVIRRLFRAINLLAMFKYFSTIPEL